MGRGEIRLAQVGRKPRPVVVLARDEVLDVRANVTIAEITTTVRGLAVEVPIDPASGIHEASVVDGDGLHTVAQRRLTTRLGSVDDEIVQQICQAVGVAPGCDQR